jgi:hypothetical protein
MMPDCPELRSMFHRSHNQHLRGHSLKLVKDRFTQNCRRHFLTNRVVDEWNGLPAELVVARNTNAFKNGLDSL